MATANILEAKQLTYCQQRLKDLGITPDLNHVQIKLDHFDAPTSQTYPIFSETKEGDIEILYVGLNGVHTYTAGRKEKTYTRLRLHPERCKDGFKYRTPKGAGIQVFIPPTVKELYTQQQEIKTLVITEGEFKAFKAAMVSIPAIGLQGIHNYHEKSPEGTVLNTEIESFIRVCKVKNIILLFDNDCLDIEYDEEKDLAKRLVSFYSAVKNFREYTKHLDCDIYFSHIKPDAAGKGLDDLLIALPDLEDEIVSDLMLLKPGYYFHTQNITDKSLTKLKDYFNLGQVANFYNAYEEVITDKPFIYQSAKYQHNGDKIAMLKIPAAFSYVRIGDDYFEIVNKPNRLGELEETTIPRRKGTILDDFKRTAPNILEMIDKYKGFCNVPDHLNHQKAISGFYNMYAPLPEKIAEGPYAKSLEFVKHIFGEQFEIGLDYLQLLYTRPTQFLPVLCLVSNENNTGKSTFPKWLRTLFGQNVTQCNNTELDSEFNDNYASRLVVYVDETFIEKRIIKERIKNLSTSEKITLNAKGKAKQEIDFFGKFILCSNNEDNFVSIDSEDIRFWVRKIYKPEKDNVNILDELAQEAPAFLYFLCKREMHYQSKKSRMWFPIEVLETEALKNVRESSKSHLEKAIRSMVRDMFFSFKDPEVKLTKKYILQELIKDGFRDATTVKVEECLKKSLKLEPEGNINFKIPTWEKFINKNNIEEVRRIDVSERGMPYTFKIEDFLTETEISNL